MSRVTTSVAVWVVSVFDYVGTMKRVTFHDCRKCFYPIMFPGVMLPSNTVNTFIKYQGYLTDTRHRQVWIRRQQVEPSYKPNGQRGLQFPVHLTFLIARNTAQSLTQPPLSPLLFRTWCLKLFRFTPHGTARMVTPTAKGLEVKVTVPAWGTLPRCPLCCPGHRAMQGMGDVRVLLNRSATVAEV